MAFDKIVDHLVAPGHGSRKRCRVKARSLIDAFDQLGTTAELLEQFSVTTPRTMWMSRRGYHRAGWWCFPSVAPLVGRPQDQKALAQLVALRVHQALFRAVVD